MRLSRSRFGRPDSRAVSTALGYVLTLTISALILSVLMVGVGGFVEDQRERVVREELTVVGQQLAADLTAADRLVQGSEADTTVSLTSRLPRQVANSGYTVELVADGTAHQLHLQTTDPPVSVVVGFDTTTAVATTSVSGGDVTVTYDAVDDELEVSRAD